MSCLTFCSAERLASRTRARVVTAEVDVDRLRRRAAFPGRRRERLPTEEQTVQRVNRVRELDDSSAVRVRCCQADGRICSEEEKAQALHGIGELDSSVSVGIAANERTDAQIIEHELVSRHGSLVVIAGAVVRSQLDDSLTPHIGR